MIDWTPGERKAVQWFSACQHDADRRGDRAEGEHDDVCRNEQPPAQLRRPDTAKQWERGEEDEHE
jgi:hypothetical protein